MRHLWQHYLMPAIIIIYYFLFNISLFMFYHVESATTACVRRPADSMIPAIIIY